MCAFRASQNRPRAYRRASVRCSSLLLAGAMDAVPTGALELSAALSDGGDTFPHEALQLILPLLPLDARACAACVCRAWHAATSNPLLWENLSFENCIAHADDATLATVCTRAGAALHTATPLRSETGGAHRITRAPATRSWSFTSVAGHAACVEKRKVASFCTAPLPFAASV